MATVADPTLAFETASLAAVRRLLTPALAPCVSVYLPTHRNVPDNRVDQPSFAHLVAAVEMSLSAGRRRDEVERLLRPFRALADDRRFWEHTRDGLAVLAADGAATVFVLDRPVRPLAVVARRHHLAPLLRLAAAAEQFSLLALTAREARVFAGTAWHGAAGGSPGAAPRTVVNRLEPLPLPDTGGGRAGVRRPAGLLSSDEVVEDETLEPHRVKLGMGPAGRGQTAVVHGGFGSRQDETDKDTEIFLRHVDEVLRRANPPTENLASPPAGGSQAGGLPLVLVAGDRLAATFRGLSKNPRLLAGHVARDPRDMTVESLAVAAAEVMGRDREARVARELSAFAPARERGLASGDPADIARAAVAGRVATLFVEADRFEPGRLDRATGAIETESGPAALRQPDLSRAGGTALETDDLMGGIAEEALASGAAIVALVRNAMPTETGLAAIYRY